MLAHVAGSVSTDLNVWERMANPCVSQADCHSATTASVVWLLALDFIFTLWVSPCPGILILDVQTRSFLDWSHTGAFDFSRLCLYQHWSWGQGGSSLNLIQALESIVILETHECTSSVVTSIHISKTHRHVPAGVLPSHHCQLPPFNRHERKASESFYRNFHEVSRNKLGRIPSIL